VLECGGHLGGDKPHIDFDWIIELAIPLNFDQTQELRELLAKTSPNQFWTIVNVRWL
jgi:hypothetical protein